MTVVLEERVAEGRLGSAAPGEAASSTEFVRLIALHLDGAFKLAGYLLGDSGEAEDAVQEALGRAWRAWPKLREPESAGAWLDRIVAVGLDSSEVGLPPEPFAAVLARARSLGLRAVAHAGEEADASFVA